MRVIGFIRKAMCIMRYFCVKDKTVSLISNNCLGGDICGLCHLRYNSPTLNLQILPPQYVKFCENLKHYMTSEVRECLELTAEQREMIKKHFGRSPEELSFPFALCDDILIVCQHYSSFENFKEDWDRRKQRINYKNLKKIFLIEDKYRDEAKEFMDIMSPEDVLFTWNWEVAGGIPIYSPSDIHFMGYETRIKKYYQQSFDVIEWLNR